MIRQTLLFSFEKLMQEQSALVARVQDASQTLAATAEETSASASQMAHSATQIKAAAERRKRNLIRPRIRH